MVREANLEPGWFMRDIRKAAQRLDEWSAASQRQPVGLQAADINGDQAARQRDVPSGGADSKATDRADPQ